VVFAANALLGSRGAGFIRPETASLWFWFLFAGEATSHVSSVSSSGQPIDLIFPLKGSTSLQARHHLVRHLLVLQVRFRCRNKSLPRPLRHQAHTSQLTGCCKLALHLLVAGKGPSSAEKIALHWLLNQIHVTLVFVLRIKCVKSKPRTYWTSHFCNCFMLVRLNSADAHSTHSFTPFAPKALKYVVHLLVFVIWQNSVME